VVKAVDTTGAGDAFIGCFAAQLAAGAAVADAIAQAVRYASHSVTGKGTQTSYASSDDFAAWQP
jgi:ribokinase